MDREPSFMEVKFPNLRWCMTDVKRKWEPSSVHLFFLCPIPTVTIASQATVSTRALFRNRAVARL